MPKCDNCELEFADIDLAEFKHRTDEARAESEHKDGTYCKSCYPLVGPYVNGPVSLEEMINVADECSFTLQYIGESFIEIDDPYFDDKWIVPSTPDGYRFGLAFISTMYDQYCIQRGWM